MNKLIIKITILLGLLPIRLAAQVNPQQGYIITNENDTVRGTIDYLTDASNAKTCSFRKDGETAFKTYHPTDISHIRLSATYDFLFWIDGTKIDNTGLLMATAAYLF